MRPDAHANPGCKPHAAPCSVHCRTSPRAFIGRPFSKELQLLDAEVRNALAAIQLRSGD